MSRCNNPSNGPKDREDAVNAYKACKLSDGKPCPPCQRYNDLDEQVEKLLAQKRKLFTEINRHHDPIISRLPQEMVSRIFECYVEDDFRVIEDQENEQDASPTSSPLTLGAVCQTWRHIAWSLPPLWTHIRVTLDGPADRIKELEVIQEWLTRSGQLPLSLFITCEATYDTSAANLPGVYYGLISIVNQYSHRWENLRLVCSSPGLCRLVLGNSRDAPILRTLCLENPDHSGEIDELYFRMGGVKPRPSHVRLRWVLPRSLDIDWSHVTRISMFETIIGLDECVELLRQVPLLVDCEFNSVEFMVPTRGFSLPANPAIVHHALNTLKIEYYSGESTELLLGSFIFPALTNLTLDGMGNSTNLQSILALIERSSARLTTLTTNVVFYNYDSLIEVLARTPFLCELNLSSNLTVDDANKLFRLLAKTSSAAKGSSQPPLLPELRSISYHGRISWDASFWALIPSLIIEPDYGSCGSEPRRLSHLEIDDWPSCMQETPVCADKNVVIRILDLSKSGTNVHLTQSGVDILEKSMLHHGINALEDKPV